MESYSSAELISIIDGIVDNYGSWIIGITQRPNSRKGEHDNPARWQIWKANSLKAAQNTEDHFINNKGMKGGTGGDIEPGFKTYVYIF